MDELIVYLIRETGWTLEYTTNLIKTLPTRKLNALIEELKYQKELENYQQSSNFAMLIANWASAQGKKRYRTTDFIGSPPQRPGIKDELHEAAQQAGIEIPEGL